ncbi:acetyl-CoA C-acetyltransferase/acetyl-CoA acyltransferase [Paraburkholderia sp. HC6.4b]|uniref:thiolase family protein n=1 Tax=unclassified Paraburkholderia TaxID=2615204 RepID=UPI00161ADCE4|nr:MULTISPECIES: thiolase family protein [unclassified Paraburkholderia]MBB5406318.1 acetyl-CoA C-acetyltransferase/acetyl-CoA acyltransferase [Paraburkholderia sp. HC6.4b]MBB5448716.1 acetyl-CoA C-acetyltransferase/acetyl-CoA acyltransferase [Paraburkholderia sp. Kb1A]
MQQAFIVDAIRSPMGRSKPGSAFTELHATELLAQVLKGLVERNKLDPGRVDDVITGCVTQAGEQSASPGRVAWLAAGFPDHVPATTIDRKCGSSQQAVHFAAQGIMAGAYDIVIACGIESMSRVPMGSARIGQNPYGPSLEARYAPGLVSQGVAAELVATKYDLSRKQMDAYAARSHELAAAAREAGAFRREILPIATPNGVVEHDETIRPGTSVEKLQALQASFRNDELSARFPQIRWNVTAGNASQISDGASAMLLMSESAAQRLGLKPRARFVAFDVYGDDPLLMLTAPIPASQRAMKKSGLKLHQVDHYEINEAFACVPLAWQKALNADPARLNPRGGAIALGHPLGASGVRLMTTMLHALEDGGGRYGLQSMCEAGGMANATIIERV